MVSIGGSYTWTAHEKGRVHISSVADRRRQRCSAAPATCTAVRLVKPRYISADCIYTLTSDSRDEVCRRWTSRHTSVSRVGVAYEQTPCRAARMRDGGRQRQQQPYSIDGRWLTSGGGGWGKRWRGRWGQILYPTSRAPPNSRASSTKQTCSTCAFVQSRQRGKTKALRLAYVARQAHWST